VPSPIRANTRTYGAQNWASKGYSKQKGNLSGNGSTGKALDLKPENIQDEPVERREKIKKMQEKQTFISG